MAINQILLYNINRRGRIFWGAWAQKVAVPFPVLSFGRELAALKDLPSSSAPLWLGGRAKGSIPFPSRSRARDDAECPLVGLSSPDRIAGVLAHFVFQCGGGRSLRCPSASLHRYGVCISLTFSIGQWGCLRPGD